MSGLLLFTDFLKTTNATTVGITLKGIGDFSTYVDDEFDPDMSYDEILEKILTYNDKLTELIGKGDVTAYMSCLQILAMVEKAVKSRRDGEWATVGKLCLDELKSCIITVDKLKSQNEITEETCTSMRAQYSRQIKRLGNIQLQATLAYEQRRMSTGNKGKKKGRSGAAKSHGAVSGGRGGGGRGNGGGRGRGNGSSADFGPHNPSDAAKIVHPDNKVREAAYKLLKELKSNGVPKLTVEDARKRFKGIKFYSHIFAKRSGSDKLYDKINWASWKNINTDIVANYAARDYALFLLVTQVPADVYEARRKKSGGVVGGVQAEPDDMAEPEDTTTASTPVSTSTDTKILSHAELKAAYAQSKTEERQKLENRRRKLAAQQKKLDDEEAALYTQEELSDEEDK